MSRHPSFGHLWQCLGAFLKDVMLGLPTGFTGLYTDAP